MDITIVLCTYNRCKSLVTALNSVAACVLPESVEWEILVVDNNSKDATREVVTEFFNRYPSRIRYIFEPKQGKSNALNTGIREARGHTLAFIDDDVRVEPDWLEKLTARFQDPQWAGAGGRVVPEWFRPVPPWLNPKAWYAAGPLVQFDLGDKPGELFEPPFGANMAFRKSVFEKCGDFLPELGPRPGSEIRNEDTEFGARVLAAGERLCYEPSAIVHHPVPDTRIDKKFFLAWWYHKGGASIRQFGVRPGTRYYVAGVPLYLFRNLLVWTLRWMLAVSPWQRFSNKLNVWTKVGEIVECYRNPQAARKMGNFGPQTVRVAVANDGR
jgi:glycosyltransferase involved in cell wall biosynthesis